MTDTDKREILHEVKSNEAVARFFFSELTDPTWIPLLKVEGLYQYDQELLDVQENEQSGDWPALDNLVKLIEEVKPSESVYFVLAKDIYNDLSGQPITNYWVISNLVELLIHLPVQYIEDAMVEPLFHWVKNERARFFIGHEICCELLPKFLEEIPTNKDIRLAEKIFLLVTTSNLIADEKSSYLTQKTKFIFDSHWVKKGLDDSIAGFAKYGTEREINTFLEVAADQLIAKIIHHSVEFSVDNTKFLLTVIKAESIDVVESTKSEEGKRQIEIRIPVKFEFSALGQQLNDVLSNFDTRLAESKIIEKILAETVHIFGQECWSAIDDDTHRWDKDPIDVILPFIRDFFVTRARENNEHIKSDVSRLMNHNMLFFTKLGLYLVALDIEEFEDLFWEIFESGSNKKVLLEGELFGDEIKSVLESLRNFDGKRQQLMDDRISGGSIFWDKELDVEENLWVAWQARRFNALSHQPFFLAKYQQLKSDHDLPDLELSPEIGALRVGWRGNQCDLSVSDFRQINPSSIVKEFDRIANSADSSSGDLLDCRDVFQQAVSAFPVHFLENLSELKSLGYFELIGLIRGLNDYLVAASSDSWETFLKFFFSYTNEPKFLNDTYPVRNVDGYPILWDRIAEEFGNLVRKTIESENSDLDTKVLGQQRSILIRFCENLNWEEETEFKEYVVRLLNTRIGRTLNGLLLVEVGISKHQKSQNLSSDVSTLDSESKALFDKMLHAGQPEFLTMFGLYISTFVFLNRNWTYDGITLLKESAHFEAFMEGYFHRAVFYHDLYPKLKPLYAKLAKIDNFPTKSERILNQHMTLAYLHNVEYLEDGIFKNLMESNDYEDLLEVVSFVASIALKSWSEYSKVLKYDELSSFSEKVIKLWRFLLDRFESERLKPDMSIQTGLVKSLLELTAFLPCLDQEGNSLIDRTMRLGLHPHEEYHFFLGYFLNLLKRNGSSLELAGDIFLLMLSSWVTPRYDTATIKEVVLMLEQGEKSRDIAGTIKDIYFERGVYIFAKEQIN